MRSHTRHFCFIAGLLVSGMACSEQWFTLDAPASEPSRTSVEVDLDSLRDQGHVGEVVIRVSYEEAQQHDTGFPYRSFVATARFDCQRRNVNLLSADYFSLPGANGSRAGANSSGEESGTPDHLLDGIPPATRRALLKAACATIQTP